MNDEPLDGQVKALSFTFKSNLGTFLSKVQQQVNTENSKDSNDIESLLTDLDRVISNQKQLSELIQNVKLHQKINKELEATNENIKTTQNSILSLIDNLRQRDLDLANRLLYAQNLKRNLKALEPIIKDPESAILASMNLAITTGAPKGWTPAQPLLIHKPPYPTEDLIRRSALYQLMTQSKPKPVEESINPIIEDTVNKIPEMKTSAPIRTRRKGQVGDQSKLLDLDLNPDM